LKAHRLARGWAQQELALRAQLTQQAVSALESGIRRGQPATWRRIARAFGLATFDNFSSDSDT